MLRVGMLALEDGLPIQAGIETTSIRERKMKNFLLSFFFFLFFFLKIKKEEEYELISMKMNDNQTFIY